MHVHSPNFIPAGPEVYALADDQELLRRAAADDALAFQRLFERHRDGIQAYLYRKLRNYEDAEDAAALTFCKAWRARATFSGTASGKAWLYSIATRVALDLLRARRRHPQEQELDACNPDLLQPAEEAQALPDPETLLLAAEETAIIQQAVNQALQRLPAEESRLVRLFYFDGYDYEQISTLLGITRSQVRGRLHRIRGRVRRHLVESAYSTHH